MLFHQLGEKIIVFFTLIGHKNLGSKGKGGGHASEMCLLRSHLETLIIKYLAVYNSNFSFLFVQTNNIKRFLESTKIKKLQKREKFHNKKNALNFFFGAAQQRSDNTLNPNCFGWQRG